MQYTIGYKLVADEHHVAGEIVTMKPDGNVFNAAELNGLGLVNMELEEAAMLDISQNLKNRKVNDLVSPTAIEEINA